MWVELIMGGCVVLLCRVVLCMGDVGVGVGVGVGCPGV